MARSEASVNIKRPVDRVFAYTMEVKNWPKWQTSMMEPEQTSEEPIGVGTTLRWIFHVMGNRVKSSAKVTEYELNKKWSMNVVGGAAVFEVQWFFNPIEGGTKVTLRQDMKVGGFSKLVFPLLAISLRNNSKVALNNIKNILEAQT